MMSVNFVGILGSKDKLSSTFNPVDLKITLGITLTPREHDFNTVFLNHTLNIHWYITSCSKAMLQLDVEWLPDRPSVGQAVASNVAARH